MATLATGFRFWAWKLKTTLWLPASQISTTTRTITLSAHNMSSESNHQRHYDVCIAGAGLSGAVLAERFASQENRTVLVMERRDHIGGNCFDYIDNETGIRVSKYGAHLFHTRDSWVWEYVQKFGTWAHYEHQVKGLVNGKLVPIPVNIDTVNRLFGVNISSPLEMDQWLEKEQIPLDQKNERNHAINSEDVALSRVGPRLYNLIFKPYTFKQWAKQAANLSPEVLSRIPVRNNWDPRYFSDPYQALPLNGYTALVKAMLAHSLITVQTSIDYFNQRSNLDCGQTYYTGPIDTYFADLGWPKLEYRSLEFERHVVKNVDSFQPHFVVNHPQAESNFTRIVEYKHLLPVQPRRSKDTIYFIERSRDGGEPYYPVPSKRNKELYKRYKELADEEDGVSFVGRLANYKYFNMDQAIRNSLDLFESDRTRLR